MNLITKKQESLKIEQKTFSEKKLLEKSPLKKVIKTVVWPPRAPLYT